MQEATIRNPVHAFRLDTEGNIYLEFHSGDQTIYVEYTDLGCWYNLMDMTAAAYEAQGICEEEGMDEAYARMGMEATVDATEITIDKFLD